MTVEGLNVEFETMGGTKDFPGMMVKKELPLIVTRDIKLVDPASEKPASSVEWRFTEAGERVRVAVKTGSLIPIPDKSQETIDYKTAKDYKDNDEKEDKKDEGRPLRRKGK